MNLKELIKQDISEMAQQHFDDAVVDLIKAGKFEQAAEKYIENHGTVKLAQKATATTGKLARGDFAKTLKADPEKVGKIAKTEWDSFNQAYADLKGTGDKETRSYKKTKGTVDSATGKIKTSAQSGATRSVSINKLEGKIQKIGAELEAALKSAEKEEDKEKIKEQMEGLEILGQALQYTKKGTATLPPETEAAIKKLEARYEKIEAAMGKKMDRPAAKYASDTRTDAEQEAIEKHAYKKLKERMTGLRSIESIEDEIEDFRKRKEVMSKAKQDTSLPPRMEEGMEIRGKMLAEALMYNGVSFWENYTGTMLVRGFNEDVQVLGEEETRELYVFAFGEDTAPIFDYMIENKELLEEAVKIKGNFLFETNGLQALNSYLYEAPKMAMLDTSKKLGKQKAGMAGFLGGLWDKIKEFGAPIVKKIGAFVTAGAKWAKDIATQGLNWLHTNPIARVAVPAVAIAGTIAGGVALINKLRKKAGKSKLSAKEEEQIKMNAERNEDKLKQYGAKAA